MYRKQTYYAYVRVIYKWKYSSMHVYIYNSQMYIQIICQNKWQPLKENNKKNQKIAKETLLKGK